MAEHGARPDSGHILETATDVSDSAAGSAPTAPPPPQGCLTGWPYQADPPQRYSGNYHRYLAGGGLVRPQEDVGAFVAAQSGNRSDMARFYFFSLILDQLAKEGLDGDLVEVGVYKGSTAALIATIARRLGRIAFLMDTFEGFAAEDLQGVDADKKMEFADTSVEAVQRLVGTTNTQFIKGYFPATTTELPADGRYCLVHIDCDLYAPINAALDYFYPRMVPGGFLIVHDYASLHWNGAEDAVDAFFADKPEAVVPLPDSAGSVVVRKAGRRTPPPGTTGRRAAGAGRAPPLVLIGAGWREAAHGGLTGALGRGWSEPEPWGIWGVGEVHELLLHLPALPELDIELDADVHAALIGSRTSQLVDVCVNGQRLTTWNFTLTDNREVRSVRIPTRRPRRRARRRVRLWSRWSSGPMRLRRRTISILRAPRLGLWVSPSIAFDASGGTIFLVRMPSLDGLAGYDYVKRLHRRASRTDAEVPTSERTATGAVDKGS